ncbi:flagellar hook-length control protein FliK, partial [Cellulomonas denverensis]
AWRTRHTGARPRWALPALAVWLVATAGSALPPAAAQQPTAPALAPATEPATASASTRTAEPATPAASAPAASAPTPVSTPSAPVQVGSVALPTAARETAAPLADQLAGKLAEQLPALRAAGPGRHVLSMTVTPEHFGTVQVIAHISAESVRVELVGATDAARDSLRAALPDLRRDLAGSGLSSDVQLGDPGSGASGSTGDGGRSPQSTRTGTGPVTPATADRPDPVPTVRPGSATGGLDLLV